MRQLLVHLSCYFCLFMRMIHEFPFQSITGSFDIKSYCFFHLNNKIKSKSKLLHLVSIWFSTYFPEVASAYLLQLYSFIALCLSCLMSDSCCMPCNSVSGQKMQNLVQGACSLLFLIVVLLQIGIEGLNTYCPVVSSAHLLYLYCFISQLLHEQFWVHAL